MKRVFLIVLDSVGIGEMPDAKAFGDKGSDTLRAAYQSQYFHMPNMKELGLFNIDGVCEWAKGVANPKALVARMTEQSNGKDTTIGHWEIAGVVSKKPLPTYPHGFPSQIIDAFCEATGRGTLCNLPYSGTKVIEDYGDEHMRTGSLIVYTSADSVFQIAAHEQIVAVEQLYHYCEIAREILTGEHGVGRVIARPFIGESGKFVRTPNRHDFSLTPPKKTMLDYIKDAQKTVAAVGKINDIFAGCGITEMVRTKNNEEGIVKTLAYMDKDFEGLCFTNLVDYDMLYGHRNDTEGYARALAYFDAQLPALLQKMRTDDLLLITADHGCDPSTPSTDHSREYTPLIVYGNHLKRTGSIGTRSSFSDIAATILDYLGVEGETAGRKIELI